MRLASFSVLLVVLSDSAFADSFQRVDQRDGFMSIIKHKDLMRFGIRLKITDRGEIVGRAFGRKVTGDWSWRDGYFCRDLFVGGSELDANNCQLVQVKGDTVRFTSDKGAGDSADLRLK